EVFASDHLSDAIVRFYQLHAGHVADGPDRVRAEAVAHSLQSLLGPEPDWSALAPDVVSHDHRRAGIGERKGATALIELFTAMDELATDLVWRVAHIPDLAH